MPLISVCPSDISVKAIIPTAAELEALDKFKAAKPWDLVAQAVDESTATEEQVEISNEPATGRSSPNTQKSHHHFESFPEKIPSTNRMYWQRHFREFCDDACLLRYLRANQLNVDKATDALIYTLNWRRKYQPHLIEPSEVCEQGKSGKTYHNGFSKEGYPIFYLRNHLEDSADHRMNMRLFVYNVEHLIRSLPPGAEKIILIFDFAKWTPTNNPPMHVARYFLHLFSSHYPERLAYVFSCNAPWMFWAFYKVISPFIHPITKAKFRFVDLKTMRKISVDLESSDASNILNFVDENVLETYFGGTNDYVFNAHEYWNEHKRLFANTLPEE